MRRVGVCGLGYVGCVTGACLARRHEVIGLDVVPAKVMMVGSGVAPFVEAGLGDLLSSVVQAGRLRATLSFEDAVASTEAMILCVGTPVAEDGTPDLRFLIDAATKIGEALRGTDKPYTILMRSTVPPGTIEDVIVPALERAARRLVGGEDGLRVLAVPEFLREGTAIADFDAPAIVVVGGPRPASPRDHQLIDDLFPFPEHVRWVDYRTAELLKCVCNAFHATKTVFANEVGALCEALRIDGVELMELLCEDKKLNISPAYLKPGGPFGGSCLPKDLRALTYLSRRERVPGLLLSATLESNRLHVEQLVERIEARGVRRVGLDGLAFKSGTDDLRESPMLAIAEALLERGYEVRIYDPAVLKTRSHGDRAKRGVLNHLVETPQELLRHAEIVVLRGSPAVMTQAALAMRAEPLMLELGGKSYRLGAEEAGEVAAVPEAAAGGE